MSKKQARDWPNVSYQTWLYEPQTEMKHKVLKYYLPIWAKILSKYNNCLNYINGFGGIGAYHTKDDIKSNKYLSKNWGSPIFSMQAIDELKKNGMIEHANAVIMDNQKVNIENLINITVELNIKNININYICGNFDDEINKILDGLQGNQLYPTFFLIDPFGFSIKIKTIERIMAFEKAEVLINFMYNAINRYVKHHNDKINQRYDELFGTPDWRNFADMAGEDKELALVNLFREQCKKFSGFVYPYKLNFPEKNRPYFYLFHLTNHYLGCKLMKEAFANNNNGEFEYRGEIEKQPDLLDLMGEKYETAIFKRLCTKCFIEKKLHNCIKCILFRFNGQSLTYKEFIKIIVDKLPFTEKEIKRMLNDFEKKNIIKVESSRNRRTGFENSDIIRFIDIGEENESIQNRMD